MGTIVRIFGIQNAITLARRYSFCNFGMLECQRQIQKEVKISLCDFMNFGSYGMNFRSIHIST